MSQFTPFVPWNLLRSVLFRSLLCWLRTGDGQTWQWRQCALWWSCSITLSSQDLSPNRRHATDACLIDARLVVALPRQCSEGRKQGWSQTAIRMYTTQRVLDNCYCKRWINCQLSKTLRILFPSTRASKGILSHPYFWWHLARVALNVGLVVAHRMLRARFLCFTAGIWAICPSHDARMV